MRFWLMLLACGGTETYIVQANPVEQALQRSAVVTARRESGEKVAVRLDALRFDQPTPAGWRATGKRLNATTRTGVAIAAAGVAMLVIGGVTFAAGSPSVNPEVARCVSNDGWFCGLGEDVAGLTLLGFGGAHVLVGGIMAAAASGKREAEVSSAPSEFAHR